MRFRSLLDSLRRWYLLLYCHELTSFDRSSPSSVSAQRLLTILSMSCICGTSTVLFRILKLVLIAVVGNVDQIVCFFVVLTSRRRVLSWPVTSCTVGYEILFSHCLAIELLIWTPVAAATSGLFLSIVPRPR